MMYLSNANLFTHNLLIFDLLSCSFLERDEAHLAEKSVEACVGLAPASHVAGELNSLPLAIDFAVLINVSNLDLDGGVVVGRDQGVGGGTLSWDVQVDNLVLIVLHYQSRFIFKTIK